MSMDGRQAWIALRNSFHDLESRSVAWPYIAHRPLQSANQGIPLFCKNKYGKHMREILFSPMLVFCNLYVFVLSGKAVLGGFKAST